MQATKTILGAIFNGFLADFQPDFKALAKPIVDASVEAYNRISVGAMRPEESLALRDICTPH